MQTLTEIRALLESASLAPTKRFGQNFLIDGNLMAALVETAEIPRDRAVLEVGPGTGSLTEELLARAARVVAVEIDRGLHALLSQRFASDQRLTLLHADVLAGKHAIEPVVLSAVGAEAHLISNLPYNIATPLIAQCLLDSWRSLVGAQADLCRFDRLTFTVQREVADRLSAAPGGGDYGPVSVLIALLGRITPGPVIPASAFWPRPQVQSRIVRIDFDASAASEIPDIDALQRVVQSAFGHRRKQVLAALRTEKLAPPDRLNEALVRSHIAPTDRAEQITPHQFARLAEALPV